MTLRYSSRSGSIAPFLAMEVMERGMAMEAAQRGPGMGMDGGASAREPH